ncbi:MAG TPA: PqqD family protein [Pyrinomonadaceae bacterium]|nr:PqqD family protein [Pyrinomonadaceae bacterium]
MSVKDNEYKGPAPPLPHDHVLFTDLDGVEGVLVDLNTKKYYQLNETASLVWRGLEKRMPVTNIAREMTELYDVTLDQATSSVEAALRSFDAQKLLRPR